MFLSVFLAKVDESILQLFAYLPIGVLRQTHLAWLSDALEPCGDIDAVSHEVAVALFLDVAEMDANAKFDPTLGRKARVAFEMPFCTSMAQRAASTTLRNSMMCRRQCA